MLFLFFGVTAFRLQNTAVPTVLAPVLLTATRIVTIFDDLLAVALSTSVHNKLSYHACTIPSLRLDHYLDPSAKQKAQHSVHR